MRACLAVLACSLPAALAGTNAFGKKFLEENKAREGVITLPSGLQYKVLRDGDGELPRQPAVAVSPAAPRRARESPYPGPGATQVSATLSPTRAANATTKAARHRSGARRPRARSSTARTTAAARPPSNPNPNPNPNPYLNPHPNLILTLTLTLTLTRQPDLLRTERRRGRLDGGDATHGGGRPV